jgi:hypothetical protein
MAVTSREVQDENEAGYEGRRRNRAAIVSRAALARQQPAIKRLLALLVFGVSLFGALLWGGGGWAAWASMEPRWWGVAAAVILQTLCTIVQWVFCDQWRNPYYLGAIGVSTATTVAGYWPLTFNALSDMITSIGAPSPYAIYYGPIIAGLLIVGAAAAMDVLPEKILTT